MSTAVDTLRPTDVVPARPGRWIDDWRPEDPAFWAGRGARVARRNLVFSIFSEHIGFSVWTMWSVMVLFLGPAYHVDAAGKFLLTAVPALVGSALRLPYTFAVATFGGRNWTIISAALLLLPTIPAAILIKPGVSYTTLMGVAAIQLVGLGVLAWFGAGHPRLVAGVYLPVIVLAALCAALFMDNLTSAKNDKRAMRDVTRDGHTWIMSFLYIGTFGSFIGFGFAFGQVLQVQFKPEFKTAIDAAYLTFLGPLLGSLIRPVGGWLADRLGGALVTFWNFVAMAAAAGTVLVASRERSLPLFLVGFIALFVFSGVGNGSTYKMIPAIFRAKAALLVSGGADAELAERESRRLAGALIGIAGALGAFGGVLVNVAFRQSFLSDKTGDAAYIAFIIFYALCFLVTWAVYLRRSPRRLAGV